MTALLLSFLITTGSHTPVVAPLHCYHYGSDSVALRGRVVRRIYPGRPNYESVKQGDRPDTVYVLRLATPLCVRASSEGEARRHVSELQLYYSGTDVLAVRSMVSKTMTVRGTLEEWLYGWQHLPVLLHVREERTINS